MKNKAVLGVDPSHSCTGLVRMDKSRLDVETVYISKITPKSVRGLERLLFIKNEFIEHLQYGDPGLVVFEGYSYGSEYNREISGELQGVLRLAAYEQGCQILVVAPQQLKQFATGKGSSSIGKDVVRLCVFKKWGLDSEQLTDDEVDAYVLYRIGLAYTGQYEAKTEAEKKVIEKIRLNPEGLPGKGKGAKLVTT